MMNLKPEVVAQLERVLGSVEMLLPKAVARIDWATCHAANWRRHSFSGFLEPVKVTDSTTLDELLGVDEQKSIMINNTRQFLAGLPANNALLWGSRGTGKSSLVKALLNEFAPKGLRVIQVEKEDLIYLSEIFTAVENQPYRFILLADDLTFEVGELSYKMLKSALDGSVYSAPENVLIYVTSNRRHLCPSTSPTTSAASTSKGSCSRARRWRRRSPSPTASVSGSPFTSSARTATSTPCASASSGMPVSAGWKSPGARNWNRPPSNGPTTRASAAGAPPSSFPRTGSAVISCRRWASKTAPGPIGTRRHHSAMVFDRLENFPLYLPLHAHFADVWAFLKGNDPDNLPSGRYDINDRGAFALVSEYVTRPPAESFIECHRKYIDIQLLTRGAEAVGVCSRAACHELPYDAEKDFLKLEGRPTALPSGQDTSPSFFPTTGTCRCCSRGTSPSRSRSWSSRSRSRPEPDFQGARRPLPRSSNRKSLLVAGFFCFHTLLRQAGINDG
jgi:beta-galactosidase beta subunit